GLFSYCGIRFYGCDGCKAILKPRRGDCCVYCSHAIVPCPTIQAGNHCCA
ncbi:MAG: GDCCVxC domain-containing (seleno)protein, partial [Pseudomonadota bacterium]|nr:GDCCVxC domain-containing (seleno)protein [Pseudomonadota bacterium]